MMKKLRQGFALALAAAMCMATPAFAADDVLTDTEHLDAKEETASPEEDVPTNDVDASDEEDKAVSDDDLMVEDGEEGESFPDAPEITDSAKTGSISIRLEDGKEGTTKEGIQFSCVKVADIVDGEYVLIVDGADVDFNTLENSEQLTEAASRLAKAISGGETAATDSNGCVTFSNLEVGVYLVSATDSETYDTIQPTLAAVPTWDEESGTMNYDISIIPKHSPKPDVETPDDGGKEDAPQTNVTDRTPYFIGAGVICVVAATVLIVWNRKKKKA